LKCARLSMETCHADPKLRGALLLSLGVPHSGWGESPQG
jgi:hypothetical protein